MEEVGRANIGDNDRMCLLAPTRDFYPGEIVKGVVEISLTTRPLLLRGAWVTLTATNYTKPSLTKDENNTTQDHSAVIPIGNIVNLLREDEDFHNEGVTETLIGLGESVEVNEGDLLELTAPSYTWPFAFKLPIDAPFSYCDEHVEIAYKLTGRCIRRLLLAFLRTFPSSLLIKACYAMIYHNSSPFSSSPPSVNTTAPLPY